MSNHPAPPSDPHPLAPLSASTLTDADYRLMVEAVADYAIFHLDPQGMILSWNTGARKMKGYEAHEVMGRSIDMFYPQERLDQGWPTHELEVARQTGRFEDEGWRLRKDGTQFWANIIITRIGGPHGELRGFSKITRDLSERRRQEEALRLSEERTRLLIDSVQDYAIFMLDTSGHVMSWNAGAQKSKGYQAAEIIGQHFSIFYPADTDPGWPDQALERAVQEGRLEDEGWRVRKDGSRFWASVVISPVTDASGALRGFSKVTRDLTERRRVTALEDEGRRITKFLAMLGHELRNPLAPISNAVALLEREQSQSKALHATRQIISRQLRQLNRLVDDLLDVGRITSGKIQIESKPVRVRDAIEEAVEAVKPLVESKLHRLEVQAGASDAWVLGDHARIVQAVSNLLNNAAKFTPAGGRITLSLRATAGSAELTVADDGPGVAPQDLARIFDLFAQGEQDITRAQGGLGLGLSLVQQIVSLHGGAVSAFSRGIAGQGSEFLITLPAVAAPSALATPGKHLFSSKRVLVVDDHIDAAQTMGLLLDTLGYIPSLAYDGLAAVEAIKTEQPDLVLLDIGLPGLSGLQVAQRVRAEMVNPPALIAVTGYGQERDREASLQAGFYEHMTKPVDVERLIGLLEHLLGTPPEAAPALLPV